MHGKLPSHRTLFALLASLALMLVAFAPSVALGKDKAEHKVTICHSTHSETNPYVQITVDYDAVDGQGKNDHSHHTGPVWYPGAKAAGVDWGDIIPAVEGVTDGMNWSAQGQAIYNNDCKWADVSNPTPAPSNTPAPSPRGDTTPPTSTGSTGFGSPLVGLAAAFAFILSLLGQAGLPRLRRAIATRR